MRGAAASIFVLLAISMKVCGSEASGAEDRGSAYVSMDSWVYTALDRLAAYGLIPSQISGLRPWTRLECARQAREARAKMQERRGVPEGANALIAELLTFLDDDPPGMLAIDSVYVRAGGIAGPALDDSFHFGQTWVNDSGRPFGRGFSGHAGITVRSQTGRFFGYVRAEAQHAPARAGYPDHVREAIARMDWRPAAAAWDRPAVNRVRPMEAYAGVQLGGVTVSAGRHSLFWGPSKDGPLSFSSNAEPPPSVRLSNSGPVPLPGVLRRFGSVKGEIVMGRLGGHTHPANPWFNAQKLSFKLTGNLEMGFTRWSIFWGEGHPATLRSLARNFVSLSSGVQTGAADPLDPGDRKGGFDFRYRVPYLRDWVTLYSDSYCDDDPSPLAAPRRAAINPGIYFPRVPRLERLDLRVEAPSTMPMSGDRGRQFLYFNNQYPGGNTHEGNLLGSWAGRSGRAVRAWSGWTTSPRSRVELGYRHLKSGSIGLPGGGTQTAASLQAWFPVRAAWHVEVFAQAERFYFPLLGRPQRNMSAWIRLAWERSPLAGTQP